MVKRYPSISSTMIAKRSNIIISNKRPTRHASKDIKRITASELFEVNAVKKEIDGKMTSMRDLLSDRQEQFFKEMHDREQAFSRRMDAALADNLAAVKMATSAKIMEKAEAKIRALEAKVLAAEKEVTILQSSIKTMQQQKNADNKIIEELSSSIRQLQSSQKSKTYADVVGNPTSTTSNNVVRPCTQPSFDQLLMFTMNGVHGNDQGKKLAEKVQSAVAKNLKDKRGNPLEVEVVSANRIKVGGDRDGSAGLVAFRVRASWDAESIRKARGALYKDRANRIYINDDLSLEERKAKKATALKYAKEIEVAKKIAATKNRAMMQWRREKLFFFSVYKDKWEEACNGKRQLLIAAKDIPNDMELGSPMA